ncbi:MAG: type IV secretion system protein [Sulfurovum sp.]|nr:type IV secretion system protein [Sulfurovum sp.]
MILFSELGDKAMSTKVSVDTIFESAWTLLGAIGEAQSFWSSITETASSIMIGLIGLLAAFGIIMIGVQLLMSHIKVLIMISVSPLFLAFGALSYTRHWAMASITATLQASVEYMLLKLIVGLSISNIQKYAEVAITNEGSLFSLLIMVLIIFGLTKMAHSVASSFFTGHASSNDTSSIAKAGAVGASAGVGAAAGAVGGASAAYSAVKEASSAGGGGGSSKMGTAGRVAAGAMMGMASGMGKGAMSGASSHSAAGGMQSAANSGAGSKVGAFAGKVGAGAFTKGGGSPASSADSSKDLDKNGFDLNQIKTPNSSQSEGEIKPS